MALLRSLVTTFFDNAVTRDYVTNTVYHTVGQGLGGLDPVDAQNHANEIRDAFSGTGSPAFTMYTDRHVQVRVYDMADAEPRPEIAYAEKIVAGSHSGAPSELAVVLSYYTDRNIVGRRGRLFLGPLNGNQNVTWRVGDTLQQDAIHLGNLLFNIGGENVAHVLYHAKANHHGAAAGSSNVINHYWVGNSWGIVHSRGERVTSRVTANH